MKKSAEQPQIQVRILAPTQVFYDGPAVSMSAVNKVGPFDVLPGHANFFSLLTDGNIVVNTGAQKLTFAISRGIVKVHKNLVTLFIYLPDE